MTKKMTGATAPYEPACARSAYGVLLVLVAIGVCAVAAAFVTPAIGRASSTMTASTDQIIATAAYTA